jgi:hypothetical protein
MALNTGGTFAEFVSNAIITEDAIRAHKETKKRKVVAAPSGSAPPKYRMVYHHGSTYPPHQSQQHQHQRQQQQWAPHPPQCQHQRAVPKALPPPPPVLRLPAPPTAGATSGHSCFNCGLSGHFAQECPTPKKNATQDHITHPPHSPQKVAVAKTGRVNYTTMEDIPEDEQILASTFSLNGHPTSILFDSGASHDFISKACTQKYQLAIEYMHTPYMISTLGGKIFTRQVDVNPSLNLWGRVYKTCLIVLEGQGIDVILGMNWMKRHRALLDTAARIVHLDSPEHGGATLQLALTPVTTAAVHHNATQNLEDIPVACEFPDVFL